MAVKARQWRTLIFVGLGDIRLAEMDRANEFFSAWSGRVRRASAISEKVPLDKLGRLVPDAFGNRLDGPLLVYNMPTTGVSIRSDVVESLLGIRAWPASRIRNQSATGGGTPEALRRQKRFSVFIAWAAHGKGLKLGADGIVPSVGNLIPDIASTVCRGQAADWNAAETRMRA